MNQYPHKVRLLYREEHHPLAMVPVAASRSTILIGYQPAVTLMISEFGLTIHEQCLAKSRFKASLK
jgi:hypothetical protein